MAAPVIKFKRGANSSLPALKAGEPAFVTDVFDFYQMEKVFQVKSLKFIDPYIFRPFMPKFLYRFFSFIIDFIWGIFSINYAKKYSPDFLIFLHISTFL